MMMQCEECGQEMSTKAAACPKCGAARPKPTKWWLWVPLCGFVGFVVLNALFGGSPERDAKRQARDAIELCWQGQGGKTLDPATQRFAAGACQRMEQDFRARYGVSP